MERPTLAVGNNGEYSPNSRHQLRKWFTFQWNRPAVSTFLTPFHCPEYDSAFDSAILFFYLSLLPIAPSGCIPFIVIPLNVTVHPQICSSTSSRVSDEEIVNGKSNTSFTTLKLLFSSWDSQVRSATFFFDQWFIDGKLWFWSGADGLLPFDSHTQCSARDAIGWVFKFIACIWRKL
jgi:hypothetical protein